jgi:hypothetical protein
MKKMKNSQISKLWQPNLFGHSALPSLPGFDCSVYVSLSLSLSGCGHCEQAQLLIKVDFEQTPS